MDVRSAQLTDAPLVLRLSLDESSHLIGRSAWPTGNSAVRSVLNTALPFALPARAWIGRDRGSVGLLEAQSRRYVIGWDITRLVVRGEVDYVLGGLLQAVTAHAQSRGVPRLFARCAETVSGHLRGHDFQILAREYILTGAAAPGVPGQELPLDCRFRMPQDAWPLHQLESELSPPFVRQLEGMTSLEWSRVPCRRTELVVEREGRVIAWIAGGLRVGNGFTMVDLLLHPDHKEVGTQLLRYVLGQAATGTRFIARVREYQVETMQVFLEAGFDVVSEEIVMVKHAGAELAKRANRLLQLARVPVVRPVPNQFGVLPRGGVGRMLAVCSKEVSE